MADRGIDFTFARRTDCVVGNALLSDCGNMRFPFIRAHKPGDRDALNAGIVFLKTERIDIRAELGMTDVGRPIQKSPGSTQNLLIRGHSLFDTADSFADAEIKIALQVVERSSLRAAPQAIGYGERKQKYCAGKKVREKRALLVSSC